MRRTITLSVTALALAACGRSGSSADQNAARTAAPAASTAARDSAAGVVSSTAGGEVMLDTPAPAAPTWGAGIGSTGLGGSTVAIPGNNIPAPAFGSTMPSANGFGATPAPAMTGVPASPIVGTSGAAGQLSSPSANPLAPAVPVPPTPASPATPSTPSTPPGLVAPGTPIKPASSAAGMSGAPTPGTGHPF